MPKTSVIPSGNVGLLDEFRAQAPVNFSSSVATVPEQTGPIEAIRKIPGVKTLEEVGRGFFAPVEEVTKESKKTPSGKLTAFGLGGILGLMSPADELAKLPGAVKKAVEGIAKVTKRGVQITNEFVDYARKLTDFGPLEFKPTSLPDPVRAANMLDRAEDGLIRRTLIEPVQKADDELIKEATALKQRVSSFAGGVKSGSEADQLIRKFGERTVYPDNFTPEDAKKVTPQIQKAAEEFRSLYDNLLERVNAARVKAGQEAVPKRQDYFTHAEELGTLSAIFGGTSNIPGDMLRAAPFTHPNSPFFKFGLPRMFQNTTAGAVEGFERYMQSALPTIYYTDPILNIRGHVEFLPARASSYFSDWANDLAGKKSQLDRAIPDPLLKISDVFRGLTSKGTILGNISTAFLQPSSIASTISRTGFSNAIKAIPETFSNSGIAFAEKYSRVLRARTYDPDINPSNLNRVEKVLGWAIATFDRFAVRNAFIAAFKQATNDLKMPLEKAVRYADDIAQKTQATNRKVFQPPLLRSRVGGTLGQLQTFTINLYNQVRRDIPTIAREKGLQEALKTALYLGASAVAINQIYRGAGFREPYDLTTFVPFSSSARFGEPTPALTGALGAGQAIFGEGATREEGLKRLGKFAASLIPGGRQALKTFQGIQAISEGGSRTEGGKLRYPIRTPLEKTRAVLFGPSQTKAGQKFYEDKKDKTKKRSFNP